MKSLFIISFICLCMTTRSLGQYQNLYSEIPNYIQTENQEAVTNTDGILRIEKVSIPGYQYFRVAQDNQKRPCVIICPGGGYRILAASHEGTEVAKFFNNIGVNAIVLKYRIPDSQKQINKSIAPIQDAQTAIYLARKNAAAWGIDDQKIGIMGFSAGGHLASTAATHFKEKYISNTEGFSLRPDFQILIYPVISFNSFGHMGSRNNLIGPIIKEDEVHYFSNEEQISNETPPAFIIHAKDDTTVPVANSTEYYQQLLAHQVTAEIYLYEKGGHGFGMKNKTSDLFWPTLMQKWMQSNHIIAP